jgi:hypothetical protein
MKVESAMEINHFQGGNYVVLVVSLLCTGIFGF